MLIDTHCHLDDLRFDGERDAILNRAREAGIARFITIGCDIENSIKARDIALQYSDVYYSAGIHPHEAGKAPTDFVDKLKQVAENKKCVAIGECGLDFYYEHSPKEAQAKVFLEQIQLANALQKTLVIHVRDAFDECAKMLEENKSTDLRIVIHCFTGNWQNAQTLMNLGCMLSISGIVTFNKPGNLPEVIKNMPLDRLLFETDAPWLSPLPHRGKRNEPAYVRLVAQRIAEIRGESFESIVEQVWKNSRVAFSFGD